MKDDLVFDILSLVFFIIIGIVDVCFMKLANLMLYHLLIACGLALAYAIFLLVYWFLGRDIDDDKLVYCIILVCFAALISFKYFELKSYLYAIVGTICGVAALIIEFNDTLINGRYRLF